MSQVTLYLRQHNEERFRQVKDKSDLFNKLLDSYFKQKEAKKPPVTTPLGQVQEVWPDAEPLSSLDPFRDAPAPEEYEEGPGHASARAVIEKIRKK
jgi:hypothetical protein